MVIKLKFLQLEQVFNIPQVPGDEIIHPYHIISFFDKPVAQMGAQKSGRSRNQNAFI
jgi:hypothetical protein